MLPLVSEPESLSTLQSTPATETDPATDLLADQQRRTVLEYLVEHDRPVSLVELAEYVTLEQRGHPSGALAATGDALLGTRRRVQLSLRHVHLPALAAADAIDFDVDTNTISLREIGAELLIRR
ncbi:DUF7344 domain-containing protein [Natronorubrum sulfidifaciens]|uniref:DUF7344 domain-containing protein n=1 Tax=Natronorubrum sulfidifaciens JCM 14089 TaxID=1230460 RepID=L9W2S8_9EURY|nr:hypothetical protein [Natronorubrum sulfidifaciens]ELY42623.1 hypothetical protein C495_14957 [Natronorubrum sulfidifaciens JCM 14089]